MAGWATQAHLGAQASSAIQRARNAKTIRVGLVIPGLATHAVVRRANTTGALRSTGVTQTTL